MKPFKGRKRTDKEPATPKPKMELDRPGSIFVVLPEEKKEAAGKLLEDSRREALLARTGRLVREELAPPDLRYKAPEEIPSNLSQADYEVVLLETLTREGRINFMDASVAINQDLMNGKPFREQDADRYVGAIKTIVLGLGLEEQEVPPRS